MKTQIFIFIGLLLLYFGNFSNNKVVAQEKATAENTLRIASTPELFNLTYDWASEFCKLNPEINIKVTKFTNANLSAIFDTDANFYLVPDLVYLKQGNKELWKMEVGKDVLVPLINSKNPVLSELKNHNISEVLLAQLLADQKNRKWNIIPKSGQNLPMNYYGVSDPSDQSMIADFLSSKQVIEGISVDNYENLIDAIQKDPNAIGFCKLSTLLNSFNPSIDGQITLMPIDKNGNGKIDHFENNYSDFQTFTRKAWIGKYPAELTGTIYAVASKAPGNESERAFLKWISGDGQRFLNQNAYSTLFQDEKQANLAALGYGNNHAAIADNSAQASKIAQFFASITISQYVFALFILLLIGFGIVVNFRSKDKAVTGVTALSSEILDENSLSVPTGLFFDKTHTWAFMEKNGMVRIGIDDFLQHIIGPLTKVKMKNPGENVKKGEAVLSIMQNGKLLSINSPVSGTIIAQNEILSQDPSAINESPYSTGWVYMIKPSNWVREIQFFTMADKYNEWIKNEFTRLKDFLSVTLTSKTPAYAHAVLQDGGTIRDNVLADLGPEVWEEFQTNFIDTMK